MLVTWEALAFVFAILPAIVAVAYCYGCGRMGEVPTLGGYKRLLRLSNDAKRKAYEETARAFASSSDSSIIPVLAWLFALIVALLGPAWQVTLFIYAISIPASAVAYSVGGRHRRHSR